MALTKADLRNLTKQLVGNRTSTAMDSTWYDTRVTNAYNRVCTFQGPVQAPGMRQPQMRRLGFFELVDIQARSLTTALTSNFVTPSPATGICVVTDIYDRTNNRGLERKSLRELRGRDPDATGTPREWCPTGRSNVIGYLIDKRPGTSTDNIDVYEHLYRYPVALAADGDAPIIPDVWHMAIAYAAAAEAALLQDIPEKATEMEGRFMAYLAERKSPMEEADYSGYAGTRRNTPVGPLQW